MSEETNEDKKKGNAAEVFIAVVCAIIGVASLRFTSGLFIRWLDEFLRLELAGYIAVGIVGFKLLLILAFPNLVVPEWLVFILMLCLFSWGFSIKATPVNSD